MTSLQRAFVFGVTIFVCALIGFGLQKMLPAPILTEGRGAVTSVIGVLATLLALVLGLLIWTSYGVYSTQQSEAQALGVVCVHLDHLLEDYGPEANPGRLGLRDAVVRARARYFETNEAATFGLLQARERLHGIDSFFATLTPKNERQKQLLDSARPMATSVIEMQLKMSRQLINPVPALLLNMVLLWSSLLFLGFGLTNAFTPVALIADAAGAFAISCAIFLITEFSEPYSGPFRISSAGIDEVIAELDRHAPAS